MLARRSFLASLVCMTGAASLIWMTREICRPAVLYPLFPVSCSRYWLFAVTGPLLGPRLLSAVPIFYRVPPGFLRLLCLFINCPKRQRHAIANVLEDDP